MVRTVAQVVKEHLDWEEERRRLTEEAEYAEATGEKRTVAGFILADLDGMYADEVEEAANEAHVVQALLDLSISDVCKMLDWRDLNNIHLALIDQQQAKIAELQDEKGRLEVKLQEAEAWNTGLRNENEWLRHLLGDG